MGTELIWTVDAEYDWGGRTNGTQGIKEGLPRIIEVFRERNIRGLFFISTELLQTYRDLPKIIQREGHEVGSHGHFHVRYKEWRKEADYQLSISTLHKSISQKSFRYRAPKFNYEKCGELYSCRKSHVSILKESWFPQVIPANPIFYIHPFDIVSGSNPPNLLCKVLYSNPKRVLETFRRLTIQWLR